MGMLSVVHKGWGKILALRRLIALVALHLSAPAGRGDSRIAPTRWRYAIGGCKALTGYLRTRKTVRKPPTFCLQDLF